MKILEKQENLKKTDKKDRISDREKREKLEEAFQNFSTACVENNGKSRISAHVQAALRPSDS